MFIKIQQGIINSEMIVLVSNVDKLDTLRPEYYFTIKTINNKEYTQYFPSQKDAEEDLLRITNYLQQPLLED